MNKQEAREFLGVSERTLQNLMAGGKIGFTWEQGKTGKVATFDRGELERFKAERDKPVHRPAVQRMAENDGLQRFAEAEGAEVQSLAMLPNVNQIEALGKLLEAVQGRQIEPQKPDSALLAVKLLLTLEECRVLTGLSRSTLRSAIDAGRLKAVRGAGRGFKVKRAALDEYVEAL
jgi:excisionase family DNA binding protein